jgi:hypothetical protein
VSRNDQWGCLAIVVFAAMVALGVGMAVSVDVAKARSSETAKWQREAVARGVAEYDSTTGEWKWTVERKVAE